MGKLKYKDLDGNWKDLAPSQKEFDDFKDDTVSSLAEKANQRDFDTMNTTLAEKADDIDLQAQKSRIDNIVTNTGTTVNDLELQDIRVSDNGKVFNNAGDSVRNKLSKDDLYSIFGYPDSDSIRVSFYNDDMDININSISLWEQGTIWNDYTYHDVENTIRIVRFIDPDMISTITSDDGYLFAIKLFGEDITTDNAYADSNGNKFSTGQWMTSFDPKVINEYGFKILLRKVDGSTILPSDACHLTLNIKVNKNNFRKKITGYHIDSIDWTENVGLVADTTVESYNVMISSTNLKTSDYIPISDGYICVKMPVYASHTTFGLIIYDDEKNVLTTRVMNDEVSKSTEYIGIDLPTGSRYMRTSYWMDTATYGDFELYYAPKNLESLGKMLKTTILVAASDSDNKYKINADYICIGVNDEIVLQQALNSVGSTGTLKVAPGNYYIDNFFTANDGGQDYVMRPFASTISNLKIECDIPATRSISGSQFQLTNGAVFNITPNCYDNLDPNKQYTIIRGGCTNGARVFPQYSLEINNIGFKIPDNQKKIICVDGYYLSRLSFEGLNVIAIADVNNLKIPVEGMIGIRGLQGSNSGVGSKWKTTFVYGCYEGYAVAGEHIIGIDLAARYCNYGFTFGNFTNNTGAWTHPITLINCADELNFNMPQFGHNGESGQTDGQGGRQSINLIDFNMEWLPEYYSRGGNHATEINPGEFYGSITYTIQPSYGGNSKNAIGIKFWEDGNGKNIRTVNSAHSQSGTSAERLTYAANFMQQYYDTDLNKLLIYNGAAWMDTLGNIVS